MIPEQWIRSLTAKNGRFKKRQEKWKKRLSTLDPHVDGGNGKKAIVYNTKEGKKKGREKKKLKEKERKKKRKHKELSTLKS